MQLHFAGWQFFVAFDLQLYSAFSDDLQSICLYLSYTGIGRHIY